MTVAVYAFAALGLLSTICTIGGLLLLTVAELRRRRAWLHQRIPDCPCSLCEDHQ